MLTNKKISIIAVCYNEEGNVLEMHRRVAEVMKEITPNYELIYVNNCSTDNTRGLIKELSAKDKKVIGINHSRNFGDSQVSYTTGMRYCTGDAAILLDGDLQDPPELFPELVKKWLEGYTIVYGERIKRKGNIFRRIGYKLFYRVFRKLSYIDVPLDAGDFSLIDRKALDIINDFTEVDRYIRGLRAAVGFKTIGVPYTRQERFAGATNNSFLTNFRWAKRMIVAFSYKPLEVISWVAGLVTLISAVVILVYFVLYFIAPPPRGFLTLLIFILFLGAIQLLSLSVIAEYLAKIFEEVKHRPVGIIEDIFNDYKGEKKHNVR